MKATAFVTAIVVTLAVGCNPVSEIATPGEGGPSLANSSAATVTPLAVTVEDQGPLSPYKIQSDGLGEYVDGFQGMMAEIDGSGNLQISPNNLSSPTPPQRTLRFDYGAPVDPLNTYRPNESGQWNFKIKTNKTNNGNPAIQDLGINGNPAAGCYNTTIAHATTTTQFQDDFNPAAQAQSTYVYITRTSVSPATWTMVTNGPCQLNPNAAGVSSQDRITKHAPLVLRGYYNQQFSIRFRGL